MNVGEEEEVKKFRLLVYVRKITTDTGRDKDCSARESILKGVSATK